MTELSPTGRTAADGASGVRLPTPGGPSTPPAHHPVSVRATVHALRRSPQARRAPLRTALLGVGWMVHCMIRRPAVIRLAPWDCRLMLPAGMRRGSTALYLFREQYEPELLHLADLAEEGSTVLDVGANLGVYTVVAAKLVGPRGRVIAIEPSVGTFELLRRNVELNDLHNVTLVNKAITDQVGQARLYHVAGAPNYSLAAPAGTLPTHEVVETQPLDALVAELGVTDISCVKIDVEGAEHLVISGARECLGHWHPSVIFEVNDENAGRFGASSADVLARLRECGYRFGVLAGGGIVPLHGAPRTGNVVARHGARERSPRPDGRAADTAGTACPYSAPMETER